MQSSSLFAWGAAALCVVALRMEPTQERELAPGDAIRITVDQSPELTTEGRLQLDGSIVFPELGRVRIAGLNRGMAEGYIAERLREESALGAVQVHVQLLQPKSLRIAELSPAPLAAVHE